MTSVIVFAESVARSESYKVWQDRLETVPAESHKLNYAGSIPAPATSEPFYGGIGLSHLNFSG